MGIARHNRDSGGKQSSIELLSKVTTTISLIMVKIMRVNAPACSSEFLYTATIKILFSVLAS